MIYYWHFRYSKLHENERLAKFVPFNFAHFVFLSLWRQRSGQIEECDSYDQTVPKSRANAGEFYNHQEKLNFATADYF